MEELAELPDKTEKDLVYPFFVKVADLLASNEAGKRAMVGQLSKALSLTDEELLRLDANLFTFDESLKTEENIFKVTIVDQDFAGESPYRKSESDVLEIFVRINSAGTTRSRSDLVFSMLKLNWQEPAQALPDFVRDINRNNSFHIDTDFVIRCLFAVSDLGTKFDVDLLRRKTNLAKVRANFQRCCEAMQETVEFVKVRANFQRCCEAMQETVEFVKRDCGLSGSRVLGGANTLIPFVYYLYHTPGHKFRDDQIDDARRALFLFGFARPFARSSDSRLGTVIRSELRPLVESGNGTFPLNRATSWLGYWERIRGSGEALLQSNPSLALHVIQGLGGTRVRYSDDAPEIDYIFPRSELRKRGYGESLVNHFANLWALPEDKSANRRNRNPASYFKDVDEEYLEEALVDRDLLDYSNYPEFINRRTQRMLQTVKDKLGLSDDLFEVEF